MTKYAGREITIAVEASAAKTLTTSAAADDIIDTTTAHGFVAGDAVIFESLTGGAGLSAGQVYFVLTDSLGAQTFKVAPSPGAAFVNFTTDITAGSVRKYDRVAQVTTMGNPGSSRDLIDASAYGDVWKDYVVGQQDGTEMELEFAFDPADTGQDSVKAVYDAGVSKRWVMRHDLALFAVTFPALMTKLERGGEREGLLVMACSLKVLNPGVVDVY